MLAETDHAIKQVEATASVVTQQVHPFDGLMPHQLPRQIKWNNVPVGRVFYDKDGKPWLKYNSGNSMDSEGKMKLFKGKGIVSMQPPEFWEERQVAKR